MIGIDRLLRRAPKVELSTVNNGNPPPETTRILGQTKPDARYTGNYELNELNQARQARLSVQAGEIKVAK